MGQTGTAIFGRVDCCGLHTQLWGADLLSLWGVLFMSLWGVLFSGLGAFVVVG
jgi:hypothetical protein